MDVPTVPPMGSEFELFKKFLSENPNIEFVRYQMIDMGGILRSMVLTKDHVLHLNGKPMKMSCLNFGITPHGSFNTTTFCPIGYDELWPDWRSLRLCTYSGDGTRHATVMCYVCEKSQNFPAWERDPRSLMTKAVEKARKDHGFEFVVGFEVEFSLMNGEGSTNHVDFVYESYGAAQWRDERVVVLLEDIVRALQRAGIKPTHFHAEGGHGSFEIPLGPANPLDAADNLIFARETIRTIAKRHGFFASCFPKPFLEGHTAIGAHTHFSIKDCSDDVGNHFLAGLVENIPALCAFTTPNIDSYSRIGDVRGTMGTLVGWGVENKDVAIRKIAHREAYWELRFSDHTSNPYYALAAWITAGCEGVESKKELSVQDPEGIVAFQPPEVLEKYGWTRPMPKSLDEAVSALEKVTERGELAGLGKSFLDMYTKFKRLEYDEMKDKSDQERREIYLKKF